VRGNCVDRDERENRQKAEQHRPPLYGSLRPARCRWRLAVLCAHLAFLFTAAPAPSAPAP
jgi:hypothetical protein